MPDGRNAVNNEYRFKRLLDDAINDIRRQDNRPTIPVWRFHDLRRTARTIAYQGQSRSGLRSHCVCVHDFETGLTHMAADCSPDLS